MCIIPTSVVLWNIYIYVVQYIYMWETIINIDR